MQQMADEIDEMLKQSCDILINLQICLLWVCNWAGEIGDIFRAG